VKLWFDLPKYRSVGLSLGSFVRIAVRMRVKALVCSVALLALLVGCSAHATVAKQQATVSAPISPSSAGSLTPTPTLAAAPIIWNLAEEQRQWIAMTASYRGHVEMLLPLTARSALATWTTTCNALPADDEQLRVDIAGGHWSTALFPLINSLGDALDAETSTWKLCGAATTAGHANYIVLQWAADAKPWGSAIKQYIAVERALHLRK
jgi:hypothetical protein